MKFIAFLMVLLFTGAIAIFAQETKTLKYNFPEGEYIWATEIDAAKKGPIILRQESAGCTIIVESLEIGADVSAQCEVTSKTLPGRAFHTIRFGVIAPHLDDSGEYRQVIWNTWVITVV